MSETTPSPAIGCIDHIVIVVDDLERDAATYRKLGFTLSPKGVHSAAMGSANHTIMLQNDYFELLAVLTPTEGNARWRQALAEGGGVAGVALTTQDAGAAHAHWLAQGLAPKEPIHFSRPVTRADGVQLEARFEVVSLAEVADTGVRIFVCSQPTREAVWLPELTHHANTAEAITQLTFACADPAATAAAWQKIIPAVAAKSHPDGIILETGLHAIVLLNHAAANRDFGVALAPGQTRALGLGYRVASLEACAAVLQANGVPHRHEAGAITVAAEAACGVTLRFTPQA